MQNSRLGWMIGGWMFGCVLAVSGLSTASAQENQFVRGEINQDGVVDLADPVSILLHLFRPGFAITCESAADVDDSGTIDLTDAVYELAYIFKDGPPPPAPHGSCGLDPTPDELTCTETPCGEFEEGVIISEIMASNDETLQDEDDDSSDWIEFTLLESSSAPSIDLGGWYLSGNVNVPRQWQFPAGVTLDRGEFLVVFASGKDRAIAGEELHTNFQLDADGESLFLIAPDGITVVDEFNPFPQQLLDVSYGLAQSTTALVSPGDPLSYHVPTAGDDGLGESWTEPGFDAASWENGNNGLGFSSVVSEGFEVTFIKSRIQVGSLTTAESVLRNPANQGQVTTRSAEFVDYYNTGGRGNYANDNPFPGIGFSDVNDFVVYVTGTILIPTTGPWSFGVNSDDGFGLTLSNGAQTFDMAFPQPRGPGDTIEVFNVTQAGAYDVELLYYERGGGAGLEFFAARGSHSSFNSSDFDLVGDTASGGLGLLGFSSSIQTDVGSDMEGVNASIWARIPFQVDNPSSIGGLILRMKYEDGFLAYINGQEVARRNAPGSPSWDSEATADRPVDAAPQAEEFNLTESIGLLHDGTNVLAIHGLNDSASDGNFLLEAELSAASRAAEQQYMQLPTPGTFNEPGAVDFVRPVEFSVERGFFDASFSLRLDTPTAGAQIRYTTNGSAPTSTTGRLFSGAISVSSSTVVRAAAFRDDYIDSSVVTHSYLFTSDVIRQSPSGQAPGPGWPTGSVNGQILDYGMDPDIVDATRWRNQIENALLDIPSISLSTAVDNLFGSSSGIYVNARNDGRAWERRTSVELIHPDGTDGFGVEAGLRIRGAFSRSGNNPKHSLRLFFRREYGAGKLDYPLFGGEGVDRFDKIDLRTSQNYSWAFDGGTKNTFLREVFSRDTQRDMGQPYTRSRYYHLYINAQYWGLFMTQERADADFAQSYFGGKSADYDVIKNNSSGNRALEATDGTMAAYRRLYDAAVSGFSSNTAYLRVQGLSSDGTPNPNGERLLNPENLMDYMACTYYTGDPDAPISAWAHFSNNVFAIYNRTRKDGFLWFRHDAEHSLGANGGLHEARLLTDSTDRSIGQDWSDFNPAWLHLRLTANREYALQFADRVNMYFSNGGLLSEDPNTDRWMDRAQQISLAVIGASARWGDSKVSTPRTRDTWQTEVNSMVNNYFPRRTAIVLNQMRSVNMFPDEAIISFSEPAGELEPGTDVAMSQSNGTSGTIYYTTDGSDPRLWGGDVSPDAAEYAGGSGVTIDVSTTLKARVRNGTRWGALTAARYTVGLEGLALNEFMASNQTTLEDADEPGEFPDWIEVYNGTPSTVDLSGLFLSDDPLDLTKWSFADGTVLEPGHFLVVLADDDGTQGPLHTNYQLSQSGETILLVDADGTTILDSIEYGPQIPDVSFGRSPDGTGSWDFHIAPTPGAQNSTP